MGCRIMPEDKQRVSRVDRFEKKEPKKIKLPKIAPKLILILGLIIMIVVAGFVILKMYKNKPSQEPSQPEISEEISTSDEFDLTTDKGKIAYVDQRISKVMTSELYANANWLSRKHYVYTELLALKEEELIKSIYYDTPTLSFSIEHMDGSLRWHAIVR